MTHYRITLADAVAAHEAALETGGAAGIKDLGLVESAIARPYWHRPISRKAAALFEAIAQNHGFVDANKRTAIILTSVLIERSGYQLELAPDRRSNIVKAVVKAVVVHALTFDELTAWFNARLRRL